MTETGIINMTKPRGPIAAMYSSPGPCYRLPGLVGTQNHDPRNTHVIAAAYTFGSRHGKYRDDCSPGPCYYPHPMILRNGKDGTPHFSLHRRTAEIKSFANPGPGAYSPERAGPNSKPTAPMFSFGDRFKLRKSDNTPGGYTVGRK